MDQANRLPRIMVVDDDPDTVYVLAHYLRREGFSPIEATSGPEALKRLSENDIDVILLDLMMPGMDGFDVCRELKSNPATAEIPIIMVTARDDLEARTKGIHLGVADFLAKPVFRRQLANRIRAQLAVVATGRATSAALSRFEANGEKR